MLKRLKEIVRKHKHTHAEIAARSGTSRTRVTAILNDDLEHVSTDLLIRILGSLGYRVRVSVTRSLPAAQTARGARVTSCRPTAGSKRDPWNPQRSSEREEGAHQRQFRCLP